MRPPYGGFKPSIQTAGLIFSSGGHQSMMLHQHIFKGPAMTKVRKKKSPQELAALILEHNPGASMEMIANVISEWGGLLDDDLPDERRSTDMQWAEPKAQQRSHRSAGTLRKP
jgi:hypothetical protein